MKHAPILCLFILVTACNKPQCVNDNPKFEKYGPASNEYKAELVKQLQLRNFQNVHYYVDKYTEIDGKPFMIVGIESEGLCAKGYIDIKNPNKLQRFKNVKGLAYSGAEIIGMQYKVDTIDGKIVFLFEEGKINK